MAEEPDINGIVSFWFSEIRSEDWWKPGDVLDETIRRRFLAVHERLAQGVPREWRETSQGCLAAVLALDQFPRNMFRNDPRAFATDALAVTTAREAISRRLDRPLSPVERQFFYMPFMHSEDADDQARSVELFEQIGEEFGLGFARSHKAVIDRFGRFPHRNAVLGRTSTDEELAFMQERGRGF